jgi:transcriptional regulator with XRE-family HTH domain
MQDSPKIAGAGTVIREFREGAGITLPALAEQLGWDKSRLSKYETDQRGLTLDVITEIAEALDLPPEAMVLECLRRRYPKLADEKSEIGKLVSRLVVELEHGK